MKKILLMLGLALLVAGCNGNGGGNGNGNANETTDFTTFVHGLLADTSDSAEPVSINDKTFAFNDKDNPDAYDDVFQQ